MSAMATMRTARHRLSAASTLSPRRPSSGTISLTATQNSSSAADELEERLAHRLRDHEREQDAQQHRDAGAEDHAPEALLAAAACMQASAITTALSPDRMMLTPMIWRPRSRTAHASCLSSQNVPLRLVLQPCG